MIEKLWFDGNREAALQRDNYKCTCCGTPEDLVVHHIDGNGRGSENPNNDLDNLQTLCRFCHLKLHRPHPHNPGKSKLDKWSIHYDCCQTCGTTKIKHRGQGLCRTCYERDALSKSVGKFTSM